MGAKRMRTSRQQLIEEPATLADRTANGAGADAEPAHKLALEEVKTSGATDVRGLIKTFANAAFEQQGKDIPKYIWHLHFEEFAAAIRALSSPDHADVGKLDAVGDDDTCTCCHGTGWYESMERHCDCEDGLKSSGAIAGSDFGLESAARFHESEAEHYEAHAGDKDGIPFPIVAGWHRLNAERIRALAPADAGKVEGDGWKPIESAPKDGTSVIIAVPAKEKKDGFIVGEAYFDPENYEGGDWWWAGSSHTDHFDSPISELNYNMPTHWRPLPSAPSQEGAGS